jgi:hypothetical protein
LPWRGDRPRQGGRRKKTPRGGALYIVREQSARLDVGSLLAFRALRDFELDFLTFFQGLEAVHVDRGEVCEQILAAIIRSDEAETFGVIEPLNGTSCHNKKNFQILTNHTSQKRAIKARSFLPPPRQLTSYQHEHFCTSRYVIVGATIFYVKIFVTTVVSFLQHQKSHSLLIFRQQAPSAASWESA